MNIIIVDDSIDKIANILSVIREISVEFKVDSAIDTVSALQKLSENKYDLLISDLLLPIREGESPLENGGYNLIKEIERNNNLRSPNYIVGLTQFEEYKNIFPKIWNVLVYSSSSDAWKKSLADIIKHAIKTKKYNGSYISQIKPTIFFEGQTDELLFKESLKLFYPDIEPKVDLKSEKKAGASWVVRQIVIWAFSLHKNPDKRYIKSVGLLDGDNAGNDANDEINRIISSSSAESNTFKTFKLSPSFARELIPIYQKGLKIPVTLEEMLSPKYWKIGYQKSWLEDRQSPDLFLDDPKSWDKLEKSLKEHINSLGLSEDEKYYLYTFKTEAKEDFCNYIISLEENEKRTALINFKKLIEEICTYLSISEHCTSVKLRWHQTRFDIT